jgi:hypothetical protein
MRDAWMAAWMAAYDAHAGEPLHKVLPAGGPLHPVLRDMQALDAEGRAL